MLKEMIATIPEVLNSLGIRVSFIDAGKSDVHTMESEIGIFLGMIGLDDGAKGVVSYEFSSKMANGVIERMMPGFGVTFETDIGMSALLEMANMVTGNFVSKLTKPFDITPPTGVYGRNLKVLLNTVGPVVLRFIILDEILKVKISSA